MAARRNNYKSFMILMFLIGLFHEPHIFLHPHQDTKVVQILTGVMGRYVPNKL